MPRNLFPLIPAKKANQLWMALRWLARLHAFAEAERLQMIRQQALVMLAF